MAKHIERVPYFGDFQNVPIIEIFVGVGDIIGIDDVIVTLETDQWTMDVPSTHAGIVSELLVKVGDLVSEESPLIALEPPGTEVSVAAQALSQKEYNLGPSIFISYRRDESADICGRIYDRLSAHFSPGRVFKDVDSIPIGVDFRQYLSKAVGNCSILLAVIGQNWIGAMNSTGGRRLDDPRDFVRIEIEAALNRGIPVVPVLVQGAVVPLASDLPSSLEGLSFRHGAAVRADPDFHTDLDRLIRGIEKHFI